MARAPKAMHLERQQGAGLDPAAPSYREAAEAARGSWQATHPGQQQLDRYGASDGTSCRAAINALQVKKPSEAVGRWGGALLLSTANAKPSLK